MSAHRGAAGGNRKALRSVESAYGLRSTRMRSRDLSARGGVGGQVGPGALARKVFNCRPLKEATTKCAEGAPGLNVFGAMPARAPENALLRHIAKRALGGP